MSFVPVGLYLLAASILGRVPTNDTWRETDVGVTIYVQTNGVHTGIVVPAVGGGVDWRGHVRPTDLPDPRLAGRWHAFGWGDREFYLNTPQWRDVRPTTLASALAGSGATLVHVDHLDDFVADANWRPLRLREDEYRRLTKYIAATFADHAQPTRGYGPRDVFYTGRGRYSVFNTCNVWTGNALRHAGVRIGAWTPFESDVMRWIGLPR